MQVVLFSLKTWKKWLLIDIVGKEEMCFFPKSETMIIFQMQDLPAAILAALASAKVPVSSVDLAAKMGCDVQKVVGAVKSLEVLEGYIETEMVAAKR